MNKLIKDVSYQLHEEFKQNCRSNNVVEVWKPVTDKDYINYLNYFVSNASYVAALPHYFKKVNDGFEMNIVSVMFDTLSDEVKKEYLKSAEKAVVAKDININDAVLTKEEVKSIEIAKDMFAAKAESVYFADIKEHEKYLNEKKLAGENLKYDFNGATIYTKFDNAQAIINKAVGDIGFKKFKNEMVRNA